VILLCEHCLSWYCKRVRSDQVAMSAEHADCFKYAGKENIISVIEDLSDWWQFLLLLQISLRWWRYLAYLKQRYLMHDNSALPLNVYRQRCCLKKAVAPGRYVTFSWSQSVPVAASGGWFDREGALQRTTFQQRWLASERWKALIDQRTRVLLVQRMHRVPGHWDLLVSVIEAST